jgi:hypothetical protein
LNNPLGFTDSLKETYYKYPALPPVMLWRDSIPPNAPINLTATPENFWINLKWDTSPLARDLEPVYGYVVYRFDADEKVNLSDPKYIIHIQYSADTTYKDITTEKGKTYLYVITALDRIKNESGPSLAISSTLP